MTINKLNKTFVSEQVLTAEEMNQITSKIDKVIDGVNSSVEEAPKDGNNYIRNNGQWTQLLDSGGGTVVVDSKMSSTSVNPVQNKVIKKYVDEHTNELNISNLYPTNGIDRGNTYTLETAIAKVPSEYRTIVGLKITFVNNETSKPETWVYNGGTFTTITNWAQGSGSGGNMILEWDTDAATTRKQVLQQERKKLLQISYENENEEVINEQYIGTTFTDTEWIKDANWEQIPNNSDLRYFIKGKNASKDSLLATALSTTIFKNPDGNIKLGWQGGTASFLWRLDVSSIYYTADINLPGCFYSLISDKPVSFENGSPLGTPLIEKTNIHAKNRIINLSNFKDRKYVYLVVVFNKNLIENIPETAFWASDDTTQVTKNLTLTNAYNEINISTYKDISIDKYIEGYEYMGLVTTSMTIDTSKKGYFVVMGDGVQTEWTFNTTSNSTFIVNIPKRDVPILVLIEHDNITQIEIDSVINTIADIKNKYPDTLNAKYVYLSKGTYVLGFNRNKVSNIDFIGENGSVILGSIQNRDGVIVTYITINSLKNLIIKDVVISTNTEKVFIENCEFYYRLYDKNAQFYGTASAYPIRFRFTEYLKLSNCYFSCENKCRFFITCYAAGEFEVVNNTFEDNIEGITLFRFEVNGVIKNGLVSRNTMFNKHIDYTLLYFEKNPYYSFNNIEISHNKMWMAREETIAIDNAAQINYFKARVNSIVYEEESNTSTVNISDFFTHDRYTWTIMEVEEIVDCMFENKLFRFDYVEGLSYSPIYNYSFNRLEDGSYNIILLGNYSDVTSKYVTIMGGFFNSSINNNIISNKHNFPNPCAISFWISVYNTQVINNIINDAFLGISLGKWYNIIKDSDDVSARNCEGNIIIGNKLTIMKNGTVLETKGGASPVDYYKNKDNIFMNNIVYGGNSNPEGPGTEGVLFFNNVYNNIGDPSKLE